MKKVLCFVFVIVSLMLVSAVYAQDDGKESVLVNPPATTASPATATEPDLAPAGYLLTPIVVSHRAYYAVPFVRVKPVHSAPVFMAPPPKPFFTTPFRDSWFYGRYNYNARQYNKYKNRVGVSVEVNVQSQR